LNRLQGFFICLVELVRQHARVADEASVATVCKTVDRLLQGKGLKSVSFCVSFYTFEVNGKK
jgi:hypothetical protein